MCLSIKMVETEDEISTDKKKNVKEHYSVLGHRLGGGPHGLGDPDDKHLRKVETDVLIMEKVRKKARTEKCVQFMKEFYECTKEAGFLLPFKCRKENNKLVSCLDDWYHNEELKEQCKNEYLEERSEYRRTGIPKKIRVMKNVKSNQSSNSLN